jgi:HSP20 family protein
MNVMKWRFMNARVKENYSLDGLLNDSGNMFFNEAVGNLFTPDFGNPFSASIREEEDRYRIELAVPGMTRKDITIQLDGNVMQVSVQKREKRGLGDSMGLTTKHFSRYFTLPAAADPNSLTAKCRDGLLVIRIGKIKSGSNKRIIKVSGDETNSYNPTTITSFWNRIIKTIRQKRMTVKSN